MAVNFQELSKCVEFEYDELLKVDKNYQVVQNMDSEIQETTSLMQQTPNDTRIVIIQIQTDKTIVSPTTPTSRIRFPIAIIIISLLQIVLHVYSSMLRQKGNFSLTERILLFSSADRREIWRFITYTFVHLNDFHLGANIFFQLLVGVPLEISHGWWRITIIYLAGVLGGSLGVEAISNCSALVGASAGVYGILGAQFSTLILNWKETEDRLVRIFILLVYIVTDLFIWISTSQTSNKSSTLFVTLVSNLTNTTITHFCGFMVGILIAIIVLENIHVRTWERKTQTISLLVLVFIISLAICLIVFVPEFNIKSLIEMSNLTKI